MIILRRDVIRVMRDGLERLVADQAAPFLSYLASGIGIHEGSIFRDSITSKGAEQRQELESLVHSAFEDTNLGLGKIRINMVDFDRASASVSIGNCFEAMENGGSEEPNCMFTSGFLAGLFAEVLDKTVAARETKCMSQGASECEFEISLADAEEQTGTVEQKTTVKEAERPKQSDASEKPSSGHSSTDTKGLQKTPTSKDAGPTKEVAPVKDQPKPGDKPAVQTKEQAATPPVKTQAELDKGVETANRIEKRKQGFWEKHFKKKD